MGQLTVKHNAPALAAKLLQQSRVVTEQADQNAYKTALLVQRSAREFAPKAHTELVHSIVLERLGAGLYQVRAAKNYAQAVEEGTRKGGFAPLQSLIDWLSVRRIQPSDPDMDIENLAFLIQQKIGARGTPAQPYMAPAVTKHSNTLLTLTLQGLKYVR